MNNYFKGDVNEIINLDHKEIDFLKSFNFEKLGLYFLATFILKSEESIRYLKEKYSEEEFEKRMSCFTKADYEFKEDDEHFINCYRAEDVFDAIQNNDYERIFKIVSQTHIFYAFGTEGVSEAFTAVEKEFKARLANKGGMARGKLYEPLKIRAFELVKARNWKSRRNAVKTIAPDILDLARSKNIPLSPQQVENTLNDWLKKAGLPADI